jgi:hypothetical protein
MCAVRRPDGFVGRWSWLDPEAVSLEPSFGRGELAAMFPLGMGRQAGMYPVTPTLRYTKSRSVLSNAMREITATFKGGTRNLP